MKPILLAVLAVSLTLPTWAQEAPPPAPPVPPAAGAAPPGDPAGEPPKKSREELKKLLAPIALYPDALLAPVLAACTTPPDIVLAKRYLDSGKPASAVESQPWDASVKTLVRYPAVLQKLDADLERTTKIGEAFTFQQQEVMDVVQELRQAAYDKGNLRTNEKQRVVREDSYIRVDPIDADYFYVPTYDPDVVYYRDYNPVSPFITYGAPLALGAWLYYGFDWRSRNVGYYRPGYWRRGVGYAAGPGFVAGRPANGFNAWTPNVNRPGVYQQRAAAARAAGRIPGNPAAGFVPGAGRPGVPAAGFRPGAPGVPGAAALDPNSRAGRIAAQREARAAKFAADRQARETRLNAAKEARASRVAAAREARAARVAGIRSDRANVRAQGPKVRSEVRVPRGRGPEVRSPRANVRAAGPKFSGPPRGGAPKAPKAAPQGGGKPKKNKP